MPHETQSTTSADGALHLPHFSLANIVNDAATWQPANYVPTGIESLDDALGGGLRQGGATLVVGRTGQGKTTTSTQIAWTAARAGIPVGFLSLEMSRWDMAKLICSQVTGIPRRALDRGDPTLPQSARVQAAIAAMSDWPMTILDASCSVRGITRNGIEEIVAVGREKLDWRLVVVDYLNLIASDYHDVTEYQTDVANSSSIKRLAQNNDVAVLCIAALRKSANISAKDKSNGATNARPVTIDDVLGAGRLCYDATAVLHVNTVHDEQGARIEIDVLKSRYSARHDEPIVLPWHAAHGRVGTGASLESPEPKSRKPKRSRTNRKGAFA